MNTELKQCEFTFAPDYAVEEEEEDEPLDGEEFYIEEIDVTKDNEKNTLERHLHYGHCIRLSKKRKQTKPIEPTPFHSGTDETLPASPKKAKRSPSSSSSSASQLPSLHKQYYDINGGKCLEKRERKKKDKF